MTPLLDTVGDAFDVVIYAMDETFADIYSSSHSITNKEVCKFFDYLLEINQDKKVYIIMDNARTHNCVGMQNYLNSKEK